MHSQSLDIPVWPFAYGNPSGNGAIRTVPEDFTVSEQLAFEPSGSGEHAFLNIEKTNRNTEYVARQLARFAGVRPRDVGYAGLKDRHAVTSQWFSVWLPGQADPDWSLFNSDDATVTRVSRHARKLQRGALSGNRFALVVREWRGDSARANEQLEVIRRGGIANYFGPQRFGHSGGNVRHALDMFQGRKVGREQRGLYLSAARSFLFNHILACRVGQRNWDRAIPGDVFVFDASHSRFHSADPDPDIVRRVEAGTIHPTGVLWGQGSASVSSAALAIEQSVIEDFPALALGLSQSSVAMDRRPLRVKAGNLQWQWVGGSVLELSFTLPAGSYATALLREIVAF
ncbi:MAG: tRNA pseudouridine(13) synthase TruD [Gammaproteobacteria bacterium]